MTDKNVSEKVRKVAVIKRHIDVEQVSNFLLACFSFQIFINNFLGLLNSTRAVRARCICLDEDI